MKRKLLWLFITGIAVGIVLSGLYRHFVTDQIMDGGNMENPDYILHQHERKRRLKRLSLKIKKNGE